MSSAAAITCSPATHGVPAAESFADMRLEPRLGKRVAQLGFTAPTPIQAHCSPLLAAGRDVMACGQTGTGKTVMFLLPILDQLLRAEGPTGGRASTAAATPTALVLAPTRELAAQIHEQARALCSGSRVRTALAYGGASVRAQAQALRGCDLLVATPGRLQMFVDQRIVDVRRVRSLVIDEADRMLDFGFEPQLTAAVKALGPPPAGGRASLMCSATFPPDVQRLASRFLAAEYIFVSAGRVGSANVAVEQRLEWVDDELKPAAVVRTLRAMPGEPPRARALAVSLSLDSLPGPCAPH